MHFFHHVRSLSRWPRALLVGLVLTFGLNVIAHAAHQHEPASAASSLHSVACSYCVGLGSVATPPAHRAQLLLPLHERFEIAVFAAVPSAPRLHSPAQPRAPPTFPPAA